MVNLRRFVVRGAHVRLEKWVLGISVDFTRESEISQFYLVVLGHQNICRLQISVNHILSIQCDHRICNLLEVPLCIEFRESSSLFQIWLEISPLTQFEYEVICVLGPLIPQKFDNISMLDTIQHCKLLIQELLHVLLLDHIELNDFDSYWNFLNIFCSLACLLWWLLSATDRFLLCPGLVQALVNTWSYSRTEFLIQKYFYFPNFFYIRSRNRLLLLLFYRCSHLWAWNKIFLLVNIIHYFIFSNCK